MKTRRFLGMARVICAVLAVLLVCQSFAFAAVSIDDTEYGVSYIKYQADDKELGETTFTTATVVEDPTDSGYGKVNYVVDTAYWRITNSDLSKNGETDANVKALVIDNKRVKYVKVTFDYYTIGARYMRAEFRGTSNEKTGANADIFRVNTKYNDMVVNEKWTKYDAVFDIDAIREFYDGENGTIASSPYFLFGALNSSGKAAQMYFDNLTFQVYEDVLPVVKPGISFEKGVLNPDIENYNGEKGSVYEYDMEVTKLGQRYTAMTFNYPSIGVGKYHFEAYFMESADNEVPMTRMIRLANPYDNEITGEPTRPYYNSKVHIPDKNQYPSGQWYKLSMDFEVDPDAAYFPILKQFSTFRILWEARATDTGYNEDLNGTYKVYFSDPVMYKYPAEGTKLVDLTNNKADIMVGQKAEYGVEGYVDTEVSPVLTLGDDVFAGFYIKDESGIKAEFNTSELPDSAKKGTLTVKDLAGNDVTFDCELRVRNEGVSYDTDAALVGLGESIYVGGDVEVPGGTTYVIKYDNDKAAFSRRIKELIAEGNMYFDISFTYQGEEGKEYSGDTYIQLRTGSGSEFMLRLNNEKLASGEPATGHFVANISDIARFYPDPDDVRNNVPDPKIYDRYNMTWSMFFRNNAANEGSVTYSDVKVCPLDKNSEKPIGALYEVDVVNNSEEDYMFEGGVGAFAVVQASNNYLYNSGIFTVKSKGEYDYVPAGDVRRFIKVYTMGEGTVNGVKSGATDFKVFLFDSMDTLKPLAASTIL